MNPVMGLHSQHTESANVQETRKVWEISAAQPSEVNGTDEIYPDIAHHNCLVYTGGAPVAAILVYMPSCVLNGRDMKSGYTSAHGSFAVHVQRLLPRFYIGRQDGWAYFHGKWSEPTAHTDSRP